MIFLAALTVFLMVAIGLVLFRRVARILATDDAPLPPERDLLLLGVLPGIALVGIVVTFLSVLHLLRLWVVVALAAATIVTLRRDVHALLSGVTDGASRIVASARRGDLFPALAVLAGCFILFLSARLAGLPSDNVDVWVFHVPLAQSFGLHAGFAIPQGVNLFYGNQPLLFELLAGTAMLAAPGFLSFAAVNLAIFSGFLLLLLSFVRRARGFQFLIVCYVFCWAQPFPWYAAEPMIDLPRACFTVAALLFAYRYALEFRRLDLTMSALLAGAAVAGKYSELFTPLLICVTLAPLMLRRRETWAHLVPATLAFIAVAGIWYLKNWVFNGNPVYPFAFGHAGLSDNWMREYMLDIGRSFDPADRIYSTNLRTLRGWTDFRNVLVSQFAFLLVPEIFCVIGLVQSRPRRWMLPLWSATLFVIWYAIFFNGYRWAMSAVITTCACAFITLAWAVDGVVAAGSPQGLALFLRRVIPASRKWTQPWPVVASAAVLGILAIASAVVASGHHSFQPNWADRDQMMSLLTPGGQERYLSETRPGYSIYRYIGQHNLVHVFQPFDNGADFDIVNYNGGRRNDWLVEWYILPESAAQADQFAKQQDIRYFIQLSPITPVDLERWGARHVILANAVIASLKPHSRLLLRDKFGMALYQVR